MMALLLPLGLTPAMAETGVDTSAGPKMRACLAGCEGGGSTVWQCTIYCGCMAEKAGPRAFISHADALKVGASAGAGRIAGDLPTRLQPFLPECRERMRQTPAE